MRERLPIVLSATALLVAIFGATPFGEAAARTVSDFARNADKVDGIHASKTPKAGKLLPLNAQKRLAAGLADVTLLEGSKCKFNGRSGKVRVTLAPASMSVYGTTPVVSTGSAFVSLTCLAADAYEPNNTQATAKNVSSPWMCPIIFPGCSALALGSLHPAGDQDWYSFTGHVATFFSLNALIDDPGITFDVVRNGTSVATDQRTYSPISPIVGDVWLIRLHGVTGGYTLTISGLP